MCSTVNPDCRYDNANINFIGNNHCPKRIFRETFLTQKDFSSAEVIMNVRTQKIVSMTAKTCSSNCHVHKIPLKEQKSTMTLFGRDGTHSISRKASRDNDTEKPSALLRKFLEQSQSTTPKP